MNQSWHLYAGFIASVVTYNKSFYGRFISGEEDNIASVITYNKPLDGSFIPEEEDYI